MSVEVQEGSPGADQAGFDDAEWQRLREQLEQSDEELEAPLEGSQGFEVVDVGRAAIFAGRTAVSGLEPGVQTDRIMPQRQTISFQRNRKIAAGAMGGVRYTR